VSSARAGLEDSWPGAQSSAPDAPGKKDMRCAADISRGMADLCAQKRK
jgi:hypothetical protein